MAGLKLMNNRPLVSFVICEHNTPVNFFREAITSVLNQTYTNIEIIIVDDKTTIDLDAQEFLKNPKITIIHNERNLGLAGSRNVGIAHSRGKYIAIMDTDDICKKDRIQKQVSYMEKHKKVVCLGSFVRLFGQRNVKQKYRIRSTEYYKTCLLFGNYPTLTNPSVLIRKEVFDNGVKYCEDLFSAEDYMMWVHLCEIGKIKVLPKILLSYRIREGQMSQIYRTNNLGPNGIIIRKYQLSKLGANDLSDVEFDLLAKDFTSVSVNINDYFNLLNKLLDKNLRTNYYDQKMFKKRVDVQKRMKIYHLHSFKEYKDSYKLMNKHDKKLMILTVITRPLNLFKKIAVKLDQLF